MPAVQHGDLEWIKHRSSLLRNYGEHRSLDAPARVKDYAAGKTDVMSYRTLIQFYYF